MSMLPRAISTFNSIPIKIPLAFFTEWEQTVPKFVWNKKRSWNCEGNVEKEKQNWGHHVAIFQATLQSCDHKDSMVVAKKQTHRPMEQNREPRNGPRLFGQLIFDKAGKNIQWKKDSSISGARKIGQLHPKE